MLAPCAHADERGPGGVGDDLLGLLDVDDDLGTDRDRDAEGVDGRGRAKDGLERVAALDPPVVATVEQPDVIDPGVAQDHQGPCGGDLAGATARPLLLGVALGVSTVDHDRRVAGDAEGAQGRIDHFGGAPIPVGRILEPVRVEEERARDVSLGVFLGHAEVHVEEQELLVGRRLRRLPVEDITQPRDVHELVVVWKTIEWQRWVGGPGRGPILVSASAGDAEIGEGRHELGGIVRPIAVDDDVAIGGDPLLVQEPPDLGLVDDPEPAGREGDGSRDVAAAGLAVPTPAVVGGERSDVDDGSSRVVQSFAEFGGRDRAHRWYLMCDGGGGQTKTPVGAGV